MWLIGKKIRKSLKTPHVLRSNLLEVDIVKVGLFKSLETKMSWNKTTGLLYFIRQYFSIYGFYINLLHSFTFGLFNTLFYLPIN